MIGFLYIFKFKIYLPYSFTYCILSLFYNMMIVLYDNIEFDIFSAFHNIYLNLLSRILSVKSDINKLYTYVTAKSVYLSTDALGMYIVYSMANKVLNKRLL